MVQKEKQNRMDSNVWFSISSEMLQDIGHAVSAQTER